MATSGENKPAGMTTEPENDKVGTCSINSGLSSQHIIFANLVKKRGGYIQPQATTISKPSCDRCASHIRSSLTDLRSLPVNSIPAHHHHHPSCPNYRDRSSTRASISKQPASVRRPAETVSPSPFERQPAIQFSPPVTTKREKSKPGIPARAPKATSSSPSFLIDNRVTLDNKISKIPRTIDTYFSSSLKHSAVIDDNTDELLESGHSNDNDQTLSLVANCEVGDKNDSSILINKRMMDMTCDDPTEMGSAKTDEKQLKTHNCNWSLSDEQEEEHSKTANKGQTMSSITSFDLSDTIKVRFRQTDIDYNVRIRQNMTVGDVIADVCRQAKVDICNDCYLWFHSCELNINDTIFQAGLYPTSSSIEDLPEVRLKYVQVLQTSFHIGKQVFLASPEHIAYDRLLNIPLPSTKEHIVPNVLKIVAEQMVQRASSATQPTQKNGTILIPLPNFSKQSIDSLPTICLTLPLSPNQFDWNVFLEHLASDLEIDRTNLIVVSAQVGSTKWKIVLRTKFEQVKNIVKKVRDKLLVVFLPKCERLLNELMPSNTLKENKIEIELKNFAESNIPGDANNLSLDEIDLALRLSERPAIINDISWNFMIEKSRQIRTTILQSIQSCSDEYVIDHASIIYNEQIYDIYENSTNIDKNEKILFHGTKTFNFDGIFEKNFQYNSGTKRTDDGWYGQGIYFSNSPKKSLNYAKSNLKISYLICSLVRLGKTLTVTDMQFKGKPMHPDYDSHYIPIRIDGDPVSKGEKPFFEEFVIKKSEQIMPLYIVGLLKVSCFVIWRDAKIANESNSTLFETMKQQYAFNIYGTQTSVEALDILKFKLIDECMNCVVVTNGADDGEGFARQCRAIRPSLPIIVYCKNKAYHQQWAASLPAPKLNVTSSPEEVFDFITKTLQK